MCIPVFPINETRSRDWNMRENNKSHNSISFPINETRSRDWNLKLYSRGEINSKLSN